MPWTPMNRHTKYDAASFILGGEIRNRTKLQKNTQTVTNIFTPCASACKQVAQLSLTNPRVALHHDKRQNFKTAT